ncbi:MAG TPA: class I tRNA ligase family protein, partial [Dehalococcoidia bacterium]|nr:class I tRNA ligase family protein [Dehalococcoidia bacterium]
RMSKSRGNVVAPDEQIAKYGADTFRCYLMFIGPWDEGGPFRLDGISGVERWLNRVWSIVQEGPAFGSDDTAATRELRRLTHKTIRRVTADVQGYRWNTAIAALMEMTNGLFAAREAAAAGQPAWEEAIRSLVLMTAPMAPHIAEELWERTGGPYSVHQQAWPEWDTELAREDEVTLVVQVNGKLRDRIQVPAGIEEAAAKETARASQQVRRYVEGQPVQRVIYGPGKLVNIVLG